MIEGLLIGLLIGVPTGVVIGRRLRHSPQLTDADRTEVTEHFRIHAEAVAGQVSEFADQLADGDQVLRARLRQFEMRSQS